MGLEIHNEDEKIEGYTVEAMINLSPMNTKIMYRVIRVDTFYIYLDSHDIEGFKVNVFLS